TLVRDSLTRIQAEQPPPEDSGPGAFDRAGAARYLDLSVGTLDKLRRADEIDEITVHGKPRFPRSELDKYIRKQLRNKRR
ncbi:hypothetical protein LCGC14_2915580, partial [marine sediment metagenome]